ncbi:unnamed protein product [Heterobilharzia americana]|nr:unnamed protein product [Heterobilharzia americana]
MSLDEFFAKQNRKKTKKKPSPMELMDMLARGGEVSKSLPETSVPQVGKPAMMEKDDEWEIIDDEKEIDLQNIRISKLTLTSSEESAKQSKNKDVHECNGEAVVEKKVWGAKVPETPAEPVEPVAQPPPERSIYIPAPLRQKGSSGSSAAKPNVASATDFPSLDASVNEVQKKETQPEKNNDDVDDSPWQSAGMRRPNPVSNVTPAANNTTTSTYVPPFLRQGGFQGVTNVGPGHLGDSFRPRDDPPPRIDMDHGFRRNDLETSGFREFTSSGGWTRGNVISGGPSSAIGQAPPSNFFNTGFQKSSENTTDWSRNVNVKTYK